MNVEKIPQAEYSAQTLAKARTGISGLDEVTFGGRCSREGFATIGFGSCMGRIAPAAS